METYLLVPKCVRIAASQTLRSSSLTKVHLVQQKASKKDGEVEEQYTEALQKIHILTTRH